jgi:hypothetical protein
MKKMKPILGISTLVLACLFFVAADHIDAPNVRSGTSDITDFYAFQGKSADNMVFVANLQGLLSPSVTSEAEFDQDVMIEFNIDTNNDFVEDLVIQAVRKGKKMYFVGPIAPSQTGLVSILETNNFGNGASWVSITPYGTDDNIRTSSNGMTMFAGPRDDPFFMDFAQYSAIIAGEAGSFNSPGSDTFAGSNVLSIVVEVPKELIGGSGSINTWVESKRKQ